MTAPPNTEIKSTRICPCQMKILSTSYPKELLDCLYNGKKLSFHQTHSMQWIKGTNSSIRNSNFTKPSSNSSRTFIYQCTINGKECSRLVSKKRLKPSCTIYNCTCSSWFGHLHLYYLFLRNLCHKTQ